mgnify:CR=1 FL=1|tara:strand:+ start:426 stop:1280 length:855 start_codon:yes stop_codon:yes gene_type:complete
MLPVFFLCTPTNTDLLKAEITENYKMLKLSFHVPGFVTCLSDEKDIAQLKKDPPSLSLFFGLSAKRVTDANPTVWVENDKLVFSDDKKFVFQDKKSNLWQADDCDLSSLLKLQAIELPPNSPSRAWLKIAQGFNFFEKNRKNFSTAIEIGSAPGGASFFLLSQGLKVIGIDPGEMSADIISSKDFTHIKKPIQEIKKSELPDSVELLAVDTNLSAQQSVKESLRIASYYQSSLKEVFLTIKLPVPKMVTQLEKHKRALRKLGFKTKVIQLPSHHREVLLYGSKD